MSRAVWAPAAGEEAFVETMQKFEFLKLSIFSLFLTPVALSSRFACDGRDCQI